jgi:hypothetical protein
MKPLRAVASAVLCSALAAMLAAPACGSDAVGIQACRDIERARCEAGAHCGLTDDVDGCKRFYRDQCLHGMQTDKSPGDRAVDQCTQAIRAAGECASQGKEELADCPAALTWRTPLSKTCDAVLFPQEISPCDFLVAPVDAGTPVKETGPETSGEDAAAEAAGDDAAAEAAGD